MAFMSAEVNKSNPLMVINGYAGRTVFSAAPLINTAIAV